MKALFNTQSRNYSKMLLALVVLANLFLAPIQTQAALAVLVNLMATPLQVPVAFASGTNCITSGPISSGSLLGDSSTIRSGDVT
ncbi:MAG TPA: hypothetical protein VF896_14650 [Anaerolineales bacterium]